MICPQCDCNTYEGSGDADCICPNCGHDPATDILDDIDDHEGLERQQVVDAADHDIFD